MRWSLIGYLGGAAAPRAGHLPGFRARFTSDLFLESSPIFQITKKLCVALLSLCKPHMWAFLGSFQLTPCRNRHSPKLMELCQ
jgi:hypothetical protein